MITHESVLEKPMLVGENNPYGDDDYFSLYPRPQGSAGWRLCHLILGMYAHDYLEVFDRTNLVAGRWSASQARRSAALILSSPKQKLILCGSKVSAAFGVEFHPFASSESEGCSLLVLPHPSGLCRLWNDPMAFTRAREAVAAFIPEVAGLLARRVYDDGRLREAPK